MSFRHNKQAAITKSLNMGEKIKRITANPE
jgi:hypothetical protein